MTISLIEKNISREVSGRRSAILRRIYSSVAVIMPAYNEISSLPALCDSLAHREARVIVVDDASTDGSGEEAFRHGAEVVRHQNKRGKGSALRSGFQLALAGPNEWIVVMDADGQHRIEDVDRLVETAKQTGASLVLGERPFSHNMPFVRRVTNAVMSAVLRIVTRLPIRDSQCGLRVLTRDALRRLKLTSSNFDIESEILLEAARCRFVVACVPIRTVYIQGRRSRISPLRDSFRWIRLLSKALRTDVGVKR